jgi:hypothetical protein
MARKREHYFLEKLTGGTRTSIRVRRLQGLEAGLHLLGALGGGSGLL